MQTGKRMANKLAAQGRGGDSMLVHMHPQEVKALAGLGALAGQPMTRNPTTGLPEAFNLRQALTLAAPIAATMIGGPMAGAAVSGLSTYATTGDPNQALLAGIASGAAGSALSGLGGDAAAQGATQGTTDAAATGATDAAAQQAAANTTTTAASTDTVPAMTSPAGDQYTVNMANPSTTATMPAVNTAPSPSFGDMTLAQKMDAIKNANWTGKGGMLLNDQGGLKMAPMIAGASYLGLQGLNDQQQRMLAYQKAQQRSLGDTQGRFDYYKRMANTMPANQIPAYTGW